MGPLAAGYLAASGFDGVFMMLYASAVAAGLLLVPLCWKEVGGVLGAGIWWGGGIGG